MLAKTERRQSKTFMLRAVVEKYIGVYGISKGVAFGFSQSFGADGARFAAQVLAMNDARRLELSRELSALVKLV